MEYNISAYVMQKHNFVPFLSPVFDCLQYAKHIADHVDRPLPPKGPASKQNILQAIKNCKQEFPGRLMID